MPSACHTQTANIGSVVQLLGTPYDEMDCWDLVAHVERRIFGRRTFSPFDPAVYSAHRADWGDDWVERGIARYASQFERVGSIRIAAPGDIVLYRWLGIWHAGVMLDSEHMIHTTRRAGAQISRMSGRLLARLRPAYILRLRRAEEDC